MTASNRMRRGRLRDFERHCRHVPSSVCVNEFGDRFIPIHPFGDDRETLDQLGLRPNDCFTVDAWWQKGNDVYLLQVLLLSKSLHGLPRMNYCKKSRSFIAVIDGESVTRAMFHAVMREFREPSIPLSSRQRSVKSEKL